MDNISASLELPETSYVKSSIRIQGDVVTSFGPKNGFLWRGEEADPSSLIGSLKKVFEAGFSQGGEQSVLANLPYIRQNYPDFICASNTYSNQGEFAGREQEELSAGVYGYIYLIDTSKKSLLSIPLCEENVLNEKFIEGYSEEINEGPDYAIISKVDPKYIIGAVPSAFVAYALGIQENYFIMNSAYQGTINFDEMKEFSRISTFSTLGVLSLKYPNLSMSEVYQNYLKLTVDERSVQSTASTISKANFFNKLAFESEYIQKHTPSSNYNTSM